MLDPAPSLPGTEEQLLEFLYACPIGLVESDAAGRIGMINPHAMQHLLPLAGRRDPGNLFSALEDHAPELRHLVSAYARPTGRICDGHRITVDLGQGRQRGEPKVLACTLVKLGPDRLMATLADISAQVAQEQRLRQADAWFGSLLDGINNYAVLTITPDGIVDGGNDSFTRQVGHPLAEVMGRPLAAVLAGDPVLWDLELDEQLAIAARDGWHLQQGWQIRADGGRYWCQRLVVARSGQDGAALSGYSVVMRDVPRREEALDLRQLLTCDHLTGVSNRMHFSQVLERERVQARETQTPLALILLDLDHFKQVNDTHGHPVGDRLLRDVAQACQKLMPSRCLFARLGGEEFGALLPRSGEGDALRLAETLRQAIAALEIATPDGPLRTTASMGVALLDEAGGSVDGLIALADRRLYGAKGEGRNRVGQSRPLAA